MKTITIPTCANPFVVIVNGIKYTYPAGATVEVPDDVAEVIEQHEEAKPEPAPVLPPYSGGVKSWHDLEDKPFGEETVLGGTLTWDGTPSDAVVPLSEELSFHRVSDQVPAIDELFGGVLYVDKIGALTHISLQESSVTVFNENVYGVIDLFLQMPVLAVSNVDDITVNAFGANLYIPKKGIYFLYGANVVQVLQLEVPGYNRFPNTVVTPLDTKFAPEPPCFDLVEAGMKVIDTLGRVSTLKNVIHLRSALDKGAVKLIYRVKVSSQEETHTSIVTATRRTYNGEIKYDVIIPLRDVSVGWLFVYMEIGVVSTTTQLVRLSTG